VICGGVTSLPAGTMLYVCVTGAAVFPATSEAVTVNVNVPSALVSSGDPFGTVPVQVATPDPNWPSSHA
jgi:hypothetical protein